jgi:hypothetical protein
MRFRDRLAVLFATLMLAAAPAASQQANEAKAEAKAQTIKDMLVVLCLAGGSETIISTKGDVELRAKIKDILAGNIGAAAAGEAQFSKKAWEGIIGGISKEMTAAQGQQATEARKCMVDNGFGLVSKVLAGQ